MHDSDDDVPTLVKSASDLAPLISSRSAWNEENRRLHPEVVDALAGAGLLGMRIPTRYGGSEADARTLMEVLATISAADGATGWTSAVWSISSWLASLFPDEVQDEVFVDSDTRVCGVLSPSATAEPTDGGIHVTGRWHFISGAWHSRWQVVLAMGPAPDGSLWPLMAMVPMSDLTIDDDWHTFGLRGTGSVSTVADGVFVPERRVMPLPMVLQGQFATEINRASPVYSVPMVPSGCAGFLGVALGLARSAVEGFLGRVPNRAITYTDYATQADAPITHFQVAEASLRLEEAAYHGRVVADLLDEKGCAGEEWSAIERARARVGLGRAFDLTKGAIDIVRTGSGATSLYLSEPIQRIQRDIDALNQHALMHPDTNYELYGRVLCGLEPNTMYM